MSVCSYNAFDRFEEFKAKAALTRGKNRIYVAWRNSGGIDCKNVGPQTLCFCGHRFKQHNTETKDMHCRDRGCGCTLFDFVPARGTWSIRCSARGCKHEPVDHDPHTKTCRKVDL
mmetsp:Transcript_61752/g.134131  ORF Transcript_61752/g.134131 Transcript_61752/m.134131 type:complete len:115 (-) Transcript_61752:84-428(-)